MFCFLDLHNLLLRYMWNLSTCYNILSWAILILQNTITTILPLIKILRTWTYLFKLLLYCLLFCLLLRGYLSIYLWLCIVIQVPASPGLLGFGGILGAFGFSTGWDMCSVAISFLLFSLLWRSSWKKNSPWVCRYHWTYGSESWISSCLSCHFYLRQFSLFNLQSFVIMSFM